MRIRKQLAVSFWLSVLVTLAVATGLSQVTRQAQAGLDEQAQSQQVARDTANLLALTNEFSVYGGERVTDQWRARYAALRDSVELAVARQAAPGPQLIELRRDVADLPSLFEKLVDLANAAPTPFAQRRRELLTERLLAETQQVVESRYRWALAIGAAQQKDQRLYTIMVLSAPAALLLLLIFLGALIARRVLVPLARLEEAAVAMQAGDLNVRCASAARDEVGDTARAVDAMAAELQQQSAALRLSQQRLRTITDNLPALIGYVDRGETYRFANARHEAVFIGPAQGHVGRSMSEVIGTAARAEQSAEIDGVLRGEAQEFERQGLGQLGDAYFQVNFLPDVNADGAVDGFYVMALDITSRKQAELQRAASERFLVEITDNMPALVAYIDRDTRYRFANGKYGEWLGVNPQSMIGKTVSEAMGEAFFSAVEPHGNRALAGEHVRWERHASGGTRDAHYLVDFIPDRAADGEVQGFFALTIDISERRRAELAAARSQQRLHELMDSIPAMVGYFDMDERLQYINDTARLLQGLSAGSVPGIGMREALGAEAYALHEPHVKQALAGRRGRFDGVIEFRDRRTHFQAHLVPDRSVDGRQRGVYLMTFDITELKQAQERQHEVERTLRDITDNLPVLITYIDSEEHYRFVNATARSWLGLEPEALIGRQFADSMTPDNYAQRRLPLQRALAGERVQFDVESQAQGVSRHLQSVYVPDLRSDGRVAGVYTLSMDVTALKQVEQQLSQLARVDTLTGLPNRRQFEEQLADGLARAARDGRPVALMFLDLDFFKTINDTLGHAGGDAVLKEFARRLAASVRETDTAARLAGDEFVVLLERLHGPADAAQVAGKVVEAMQAPFLVAGGLHRVSTSIGVAFCGTPRRDSPLMATADEALYAAKKAGRNTFAVLDLDAGRTDAEESAAA